MRKLGAGASLERGRRDEIMMRSLVREHDEHAQRNGSKIYAGCTGHLSIMVPGGGVIGMIGPSLQLNALYRRANVQL
jgi:hypothetical protein